MFITAALIVISILLIMAWLSKSGQAPGLNNNMLAPCANKPNCACSEDDKDTQHYIAPLPIPNNALPKAMHAIKTSIASLGGEVITHSDTYLAATFASTFFGFIDDVEFRIDDEHYLIHIRSSARVGHNDFGINKKRTEALKANLRQQLTQASNSASDQ